MDNSGISNQQNDRVDFLINIWRNIYIKSQILKYYIEDKVYVTSRNQLLNYEYRNLIRVLICDIEDTALEINDIPSSVQVLVLLERCEQPKVKGVIPSNIKEVYYGVELDSLHSKFKIKQFKNLSASSIISKKLLFSTFNEPLKRDVLPVGLKSIIFGNKISHIEIGNLPNTLESIRFGTRFNSTFKENSIPQSIRSITFGRDYNQSLSKVLPINLEYLLFDRLSDFNQPLLPGDIPSTVHTIEFGQKYCRDIENCLPSSVTSLSFGEWYSKVIRSNTLPPYLTTLNLSPTFNQSSLRDVIPNTVKSLSLGVKFNQTLQYGDLPVSLERLLFSDYFNRPLQIGSSNISIFQHCNNLHTIVFGNSFNQKLVGLPVSLTSLTLGHRYNTSITQDSLPPSLETLVIGNGFTQVINEKTLPPSITSLSFGSSFNHNIEHVLLDLPNIKSFSVGSSFNQNSYKLLKLLPQLQVLRIGDNFDSKFKNAIPTSLHTIYIPSNYSFKLDQNHHNNHNQNNNNKIKIKYL